MAHDTALVPAILPDTHMYHFDIYTFNSRSLYLNPINYNPATKTLVSYFSCVRFPTFFPLIINRYAIRTSLWICIIKFVQSSEVLLRKFGRSFENFAY